MLFKLIDRNRDLSRFLESLSSNLAKQRGLTIVIGVLLVIVSFIVSLVNLAVPTPVLDVIWSVTHHLGLIVALIGILLVQPLGQ
ncbi:MAG: hypothetical protein SF162_04820 [bacterium]|nr:hypothetical protein [bacterium]